MNQSTYSTDEPTRAQIDELAGPAIIEFGNDWCSHCQAAQPLIVQALSGHPSVRHIKIADGPGRPLGRSFRVKLWPTLIFLDAGADVARLVRPASALQVAEALLKIAPAKA